ncbi:MAG: hypothetical protein C0601_11235 [Candidatus Muiribacterium halophilum]|uniref:Radical SAM core domain-containing protein n=1 Tax=Muiribacterium halophilum TaxID=2053465 RepID=A0A2N5ZBZ3_MUIH1|nr:MAG: hypothetical protein C0601_11235 [Candidatus Muirbacterium halophilum]
MNKIELLNSVRPFLTLELTNLCNYNCLMCYREKVDMNERGFMSKKMFIRIIDDIRANGLFFQGLKLSWLGEALIHPDINFFFEFLAEKNDFFNCLAMDTNTSFLTNRVFHNLEKIKNDIFLFISLDAASENTYSRIRKGGIYKEVIDNIDYILKNRPQNIFLRLQFIVMEENIKESKDFIRYWNKKIPGIPILFEEDTCIKKDYIYFRKLITRKHQENADMLHRSLKPRLIRFLEEENMTNRIIERKPDPLINTRDKKPLACEKLWTMPIVRFNGDVGYCNNDPEMSLKLGNTNRAPFSDIWMGPIAEQRRLSCYNGKYPKKCKDCLYRECNISPDFFKEYF